jgi:hypothetical protein
VERNGFRNVYLDKVEPAPGQAPTASSRSNSDPDEAAWRTALDAAPYLLSEEAAAGEITPEEAFEELKPFKDLVSEDIRASGRQSSDND